MSYVRHKTRAFRDSGDIPELIRRRSEGRLKTYPSVEDARAWCCGSDDRRQQILDYVISDIEECGVGKYVPVDTVINTLLANKNADCGKLANEVDELQRLLDMYSKLELSEDQKRALEEMKAGIKKAGESLESMTDKSEVCAAVKREQEGGVPCSALDKYNDQDLKAIIITKDAEVIALKNQLAAMHAECDQYLSGKSQPDRFKEVVKERDSLKKELRDSKHEIESLRSRLDDPCVKEIEVLENEISRLKSKGQLTQDEETEIIRKEIQVLKKYCAKLAAIEEENQNLKQQLKQTSGAIICGPGTDLKSTDERDRLNARIKELEKELLKYKNLPDDIDTMRRKSQMLDSVSDECKNLRSSLENMKGVEQEIRTLKKKATNADQLQNQLDSKNQEIRCLSRCAKEADALRRERDNLRSKQCGIETQYRQLQDKVKYLENIKCEREMYKMKYEQLLGLECHCEMLKAQVNKFRSIDQDRDSLVKQVKECECCIADQEAEIKKLICHIESMNKGNNEKQARMQKEIINMKNELNQKNNLIEMSEQKLCSVQEHLKKTIKGVSCESSCLRARIAELEERLGIQGKVKNASCGIVEPNELEDEHYKEMFVESKRAIKRISEEIENRYTDLETVNQEELVRLGAENRALRQVSQKSDQDRDTMVKFDKANKKIATLEKQLSESMDDVQRLNAETGALKKISTEGFTNDDKFQEQKRINAELKQQLNECKNRVKQLNEAESELGRLGAENNTLRKLSVDLQNYSNVKVEDISDRLRKANAQINDLESELKIARDERDQLNKIVRKYKESEVLGKPVEFGSECDELMEQLKKCRAELQKEIKSRQERECAYKRSLMGDYANLKAQLETEQKKSADAEASLKRIQEHPSEIDGSDLQRLSKDFEHKLNQSALELEVANNIKKQKEKEIKSLHSKFNDSIGKLQSSHEEVLKQVDKEHSKELNNLRSELITSRGTVLKLEEKCRCLERQKNAVVPKKVPCIAPQTTSSVAPRALPCVCPRRSVDASVSTTSEYICICSQQMANAVASSPMEMFQTTMDTRPIAPNVTQENISSIAESLYKCTSQFHQILLKIIQFGLESLAFDELKYLHNKTCEAGALIHKQPMSDKSMLFSTATNPIDGDRQRLIKRITALENDLIKKQEQTHQKVGALQLSIKMERQRLQHIKTLLDTEKNRNNELMVKIGAQSRAVANMQMERDTMMKKSACNEQKLQTLIRQEQMQIQKLEEKLAKEKQSHKREMDSIFNPRQGKPGCSCGHGNTSDYEHGNTDSSTYSEPYSQKSHQCKCKSSRSQRRTSMEDID